MQGCYRALILNCCHMRKAYGIHESPDGSHGLHMLTHMTVWCWWNHASMVALDTQLLLTLSNMMEIAFLPSYRLLVYSSFSSSSLYHSSFRSKVHEYSHSTRQGMALFLCIFVLATNPPSYLSICFHPYSFLSSAVFGTFRFQLNTAWSLQSNETVKPAP